MGDGTDILFYVFGGTLLFLRQHKEATRFNLLNETSPFAGQTCDIGTPS